MQTPKSKPASLEVPTKTSPATPRTAHQLKTSGSASDPISISPNTMSRTPKDRSPKVIERRSPRSPVTEKKRPSRVSELESNVTRLQDDLKNTKDQLSSFESLKKRAQQDAEETKKQLSLMSAKLEESQQQLMKLSSSEETRVQELRKVSQDRDREWESELESVRKQHAKDSAALVSATSDVQKLKKQLGMVSQTTTAVSNIQILQLELSETLVLIENMKSEHSECKKSESNALDVLRQTTLQIKSLNETVETLRSEAVKAKENYSSLALELEQSNGHVNSLEGLLSKLGEDEEKEETKELKMEFERVKSEADQLRSALDSTEMRYQEVYIQSTLQIRSAYEQVEHTKSESCLREVELAAELQKAQAEIKELKENLMDIEIKFQNISKQHDLTYLKANLTVKESELQNITNENLLLKSEIQNKEMEKIKETDRAIALVETARAAEQEALIKINYITEEMEKSSRRVARMSEQLDAAQATNTEMEGEMRRLKVQSDQWRKAAEAAAAMLSTGNNNGKYIERTGSLDNNYHSIGAKMSSPLSDDMDYDSPKKKNGNMLKKIGVLWKKGQK